MSRIKGILQGIAWKHTQTYGKWKEQWKEWKQKHDIFDLFWLKIIDIYDDHGWGGGRLERWTIYIYIYTYFLDYISFYIYLNMKL